MCFANKFFVAKRSVKQQNKYTVNAFQNANIFQVWFTKYITYCKFSVLQFCFQFPAFEQMNTDDGSSQNDATFKKPLMGMSWVSS